MEAEGPVGAELLLQKPAENGHGHARGVGLDLRGGATRRDETGALALENFLVDDILNDLLVLFLRHLVFDVADLKLAGFRRQKVVRLSVEAKLNNFVDPQTQNFLALIYREKSALLDGGFIF